LSGCVAVGAGGRLLMAVEVGEGFGVVRDHGVKVERLRIGEVGVGNCNGDGGPVGAEPAAEAVGVVARAEVVVAGFRVAFLAFELVDVLRASVGDGALAAVGVEVGIVTDATSIRGDGTGRAEEVLDVIDGCAARGQHGDAFAAEENVFGGGVAGGVGFGKDVAAGAVPIELAADFRGAAAVAVIGVSDSTGRLQLTLAVPGVGVDAVVGGVAGKIVRKAGKMIIAIRSFGEAAFLSAAGVTGVRRGGDGLQVAPGIEAKCFAPAVCGTGGMRGSGQRRDDAIELVVGESLRARGIEVVGDAVDVTGVMGGDGIDEVIGDVDGVATGRRCFEFVGLEATVVGMGEVEAGKGRGLADGEGVERALGRVADFTSEAACRGGLEVGGVSDAVGAVHGSAGPVGAVIGVIDGAAGGVDDGSQISG